jgi:segregation and condensation protein A
MSDIAENSVGQLVFELEAFDGPLDLLLYLIKRDEVDIYDIPVAEITRQYLGYIEACKELNLEVAGEFIYMASMLIRIKAQMLLPRLEEEEIEDPRTELVNALLEYRKIKHTAGLLEQMSELQAMRYPRGGANLEELPVAGPELVRVDIAALMIAFGDLLRRAPRETIYEVRHQQITVEMRREHILALLSDRETVKFDELFLDDPRKIVMVVTFIAILELVKQGILGIEQATGFSPIRLFKGEDNERLLPESA